MNVDCQPRNVPKSEEIWSRIEAAMEHLDWSAADLARASGVPSPTISRWKGGNNDPSREQLQKVAKALRLTVDHLIGDVDMPAFEREPATVLSKPESDLVFLYRRNERFRRIVRNLIEELELKVEE